MKDETINTVKRYLEVNANGAANAKKIVEIMQVIGLDNRTIRNVITVLRNEYQMPIISLSDGDIQGYFLYSGDPQDREHAEHFIAETWHRIGEIRKIVEPVQRALGGEHQLELFKEVI